MMLVVNGKNGVEIIGVFKGQKQLQREGFEAELYKYLLDKEVFDASLGQSYVHLFPEKESVIFLGLGDEKDLSMDHLRKAFYSLGKKLEEYKVPQVKIRTPISQNLSFEEQISAIGEGILQSDYRFDKYLKNKKGATHLKEFNFLVEPSKETLAEKVISESIDQIEGVFFARDLVNEPASSMTPTELSIRAKEKLEKAGIEVEVLGKDQIKKLEMEAFLSVSEGSSEEPKLLIMKWKGDLSSEKNRAFVGKGLTYDSGGYCIKSAEAMSTMKSDMAGAASVIGAMYSIAKSKIRCNVVAVVAACENMISGKAYKAGDIVHSMSGKTIEIVNTDAEGRLTLADALWYTKTVWNPVEIIDLATLTYSTIAALGNLNSAAVSNNAPLVQKIKKAAQLAGEPIWELPNDEGYKEINKSDMADLRNDDRGNAGAIAAGLFLGEFVGSIPWVHLDIAGTAYADVARGYLPKGATGIHVKTLYRLAKVSERGDETPSETEEDDS
jgi:leucyl aminopeptidase